jgi:hypothetical protein
MGKPVEKTELNLGGKYGVCRIHRLINVKKIKLETQFRPRRQNQKGEIKTKRNVRQIV